MSLVAAVAMGMLGRHMHHIARGLQDAQSGERHIRLKMAIEGVDEQHHATLSRQHFLGRGPHRAVIEKMR